MLEEKKMERKKYKEKNRYGNFVLFLIGLFIEKLKENKK